MDYGILTRRKQENIYEYSTSMKEEQVQQSLSKRLLQTAYKGARMKLILHALGQQKTSKEELDTLQNWLNQQKEQTDD